MGWHREWGGTGHGVAPDTGSQAGVPAADPSRSLSLLPLSLPVAGILQEATGAASPAAIDTTASWKAAAQRGELTQMGAGPSLRLPSDLAANERGTSSKTTRRVRILAAGWEPTGDVQGDVGHGIGPPGTQGGPPNAPCGVRAERALGTAWVGRRSPDLTSAAAAWQVGRQGWSGRNPKQGFSCQERRFCRSQGTV